VSIKIKACTKCWREYTLEMWELLPLVSVDEHDGAETRNCPCSLPLIVDVCHLATLELRTPDERLAAARVLIATVKRRSRLRRLRLPALVAVLIVAMACVAFALWSG